MIRFHHVFGSQTGKMHEFNQPIVRFGRLPDNEVAFDPFADLDASGRHAEVHLEADGYVVIDSGSRNGTMVNGDRVQRRVLSNGDIIEFGRGGPRVRCEILEQAAQMAFGNAPTAAYAAISPQDVVAPAPEAPKVA